VNGRIFVGREKGMAAERALFSVFSVLFGSVHPEESERGDGIRIPEGFSIPSLPFTPSSVSIG